MDLVVGIGNTLRSDDGVGIRVVESLGSRAGVETALVHELTLDLVDALGRAERVLFVDAHAVHQRLRLSAIPPSTTGASIGHAMSPETLLVWTSAACGRAPKGWLLAVPARSFDVGEGLSPETERIVPEARRAAIDWLEGSKNEEDA